MYRDKVAAGVAYLDNLIPEWHKRINIEILNMDLPDKCICGQLGLSGSYVKGSLCERLPMSEKLGFFIGCTRDESICLRENELLKQEWVKVIESRLAL